MAHVLNNSNLEIYIDLPLENYNFSRFDWTGKITAVKFKNIYLSSSERKDGDNEHDSGKGFYNEFGIDTALGFEETEVGDWFHKIGVGLLKKTDKQYLFSKKYEIKPAQFEVMTESNKVIIVCKSPAMRAYSYVLRKEIELYDGSFRINYFLENTGEKDIITNEYCHNFTAINKELIGRNYTLELPFQIKPELFGDTVNPEGKVEFGQNEVSFNDIPTEPFFFSNLTGNATVAAQWKLVNTKRKIGISETGSFQTNKVNLWGWGHVISPELFCNIFIKPGQSAEWSRTYDVYEVI